MQKGSWGYVRTVTGIAGRTLILPDRYGIDVLAPYSDVQVCTSQDGLNTCRVSFSLSQHELVVFAGMSSVRSP